MNTHSVWRPDKDEVVVEHGAVATAHPIAVGDTARAISLEGIAEMEAAPPKVVPDLPSETYESTGQTAIGEAPQPGEAPEPDAPA